MEFKVQRESVHKTSVHLEPQIQHFQQPQLLIEPVDIAIRAAPPPEIAYHSYPDAQSKLEPVSISISRPIKTESITASQPGEDRIIRELMEQRSREEELRRHWKEMGLEVTDADEHGNDAFMGAFKEHEVVKSDTTDGEEVVLRRKEASVREPNLTSQGHPQEPIIVSKNNRNSQEMTRSSSKVQPFEDIEMIQRESMIYRMVPQNETLIEREIRAAHEREAALRQARGLPLENGNSHEDSIEVEVERSSIRLDNSGGTSLNPEQSMKKFAEIRLRSELQKEKKREMDLLQQGKIRSISEHNIGNPMKYIEVVPPDTDHARHFIRSSSATDKPVIKIEASSNNSVKFSPCLQTIAHEPPRIQQAEPVVEEKYTAAKFTVGSPPAPAVSSSKELPVVLRNVSFQGNLLDDASVHHLATRTEADKRIEDEVAEVQRRENELRQVIYSCSHEHAHARFHVHAHARFHVHAHACLHEHAHARLHKHAHALLHVPAHVCSHAWRTARWVGDEFN